MGYQQGFVVSIVNGGKVIRESSLNDERTARLPFGSEYALRIQNKTKKRAYCSIKIDGTDALSGKLVLQPGEKIDLERFCLDGDLTKGNKFKFVEATNSGVQDPTSGDNGHVVVTFEPELESRWSASTSGILRGMEFSSSAATNSSLIGDVYASNSATNHSGSTFTLPETVPVAADVGATVEGAQSNQKFQSTNEWFMTSSPVVIGIHLKGMIQEKPKPWSIFAEKDQLKVRYSGTVLPVESAEITATHIVFKVPLQELSIG